MAGICLLIRLALCIGQGPMPKLIPQTNVLGTPSVIYAQINSPKQLFRHVSVLWTMVSKFRLQQQMCPCKPAGSSIAISTFAWVSQDTEQHCANESTHAMHTPDIQGIIQVEDFPGKLLIRSHLKD